MPDASDQDAELFVIEPVTQLDGSPVPQKARPRAAPTPGALGLPGQVALAVGLALLFCFFLPWSYFPIYNGGPIGELLQTQTNYSGWDTALGVTIGLGRRLALFVDLWLIPIIAAALLALPWVYRQRLFSARLTLGTVMALSTLALLVEVGFYVQILLLKPALFGSYGALWGFYVTVVVSVVVIAVCVWLFRRAGAQQQDPS